jgi:hypothetical protein
VPLMLVLVAVSVLAVLVLVSVLMAVIVRVAMFRMLVRMSVRMFMFMLVMSVFMHVMDVELSGGDAAAFDLLERDGGARVHRSDGAGDSLRICSRIRQRADQHVAANPGECVQIASNGH